jgi:hypothetical protein
MSFLECPLAFAGGTKKACGPLDTVRMVVVAKQLDDVCQIFVLCESYVQIPFSIARKSHGFV